MIDEWISINKPGELEGDRGEDNYGWSTVDTNGSRNDEVRE